MSWSIQLDSTELNNTTYNVSKVLDDSTPEREINMLKTNGVDGVVIIDDRLDSKTIEINGVLTAATPAALQTAIDSFNALCARKDKNLDITPSGGVTRRYVVRMIGGVKYARDYYHTTYVPFVVKFFVGEGIGKDTSATTALAATSVTTERSPTPSGSHTLALAGSATPKPIISITVTTKGKADLLTLTNDDTSEAIKIDLDSGFVNGDVVAIDAVQQLVTKNGVAISSRGTLPTWALGNNNIHLDVQGATYVLDVTGATSTSTGSVVGNSGGVTQCFAQSFVPTESGYLSRIVLNVTKHNSPGSLQIRLFSDNGGRPYANLISGETGWSVPAASISTGGGDVNCDDSTPLYYLTAGVRYWMIITTTNSAGNYYTVNGSGSTSEYANGTLLMYAAISEPADPASWTDYTGTMADLAFKTYRGQGGSPDWTLSLSASYTKRYL